MPLQFEHRSGFHGPKTWSYTPKSLVEDVTGTLSVQEVREEEEMDRQYHKGSTSNRKWCTTGIGMHQTERDGGSLFMQPHRRQPTGEDGRAKEKRTMGTLKNWKSSWTPSWKLDISSGQTLVDSWSVIKRSWYYNNPPRNILLHSQSTAGSRGGFKGIRGPLRSLAPCDPQRPLVKLMTQEYC